MGCLYEHKQRSYGILKFLFFFGESMNVRELYQVMLVSIISVLVIVLLSFKLYILIIPILLFSLYLAIETRIPDVKDAKTFYEYVRKVYGRNFVAMLRKKFNIIEGDNLAAFFPSTIKDNTIVISGDNLILKFNSNVVILSKYEGIDYLVNIIKKEFQQK